MLKGAVDWTKLYEEREKENYRSGYKDGNKYDANIRALTTE